MSARRSKRTRDWPPHLYEERPGYYTFRYMQDGTSKRFIIGNKPLTVAISEAVAANLHLAKMRPSLVDQITGNHHTVAEVIERMPLPAAKESQAAYRTWDREILARLGSRQIKAVTVDDCAQLVDDIIKSGRATTARQVRARLVMMCTRAQQLGWLPVGVNPASVTADPTVTVRRERLTQGSFQAIYAQAPAVAPWLQRAMLLALVTGQDRSTVCAMRRQHVADGWLTVWRGKTKRTNRPVAIPLTLTLQVLSVSLADLVAHDTGVRSEYLLHHVTANGSARPGDPVSVKTVTSAFARARELAGINGDSPPTFHELRSLSKRLYVQQGNVDTKALLGHASDSAAALYEDPRGVEPVRVRVG